MMTASTEMKFRMGEAQDAKAIAALVNSAYRGESSQRGWTTEADLLGGQRTDEEAILAEIQKPKSYFLLGFQEGKLLASLQLEVQPSKVCYFGMFAVDPLSQSSGLGKKMMVESEAFAKARGCHQMEMTVITLRRELILFYERRGYVFTGEIRPFPAHNERFGLPKRSDLELGVWRKNL